MPVKAYIRPLRSVLPQPYCSVPLGLQCYSTMKVLSLSLLIPILQCAPRTSFSNSSLSLFIPIAVCPRVHFFNAIVLQRSYLSHFSTVSLSFLRSCILSCIFTLAKCWRANSWPPKESKALKAAALASISVLCSWCLSRSVSAPLVSLASSSEDTSACMELTQAKRLR